MAESRVPPIQGGIRTAAEIRELPGLPRPLVRARLREPSPTEMNSDAARAQHLDVDLAIFEVFTAEEEADLRESRDFGEHPGVFEEAFGGDGDGAAGLAAFAVHQPLKLASSACAPPTALSAILALLTALSPSAVEPTAPAAMLAAVTAPGFSFPLLIAPFLIFAVVTEFFFSCLVPTEFLVR